MWKMGIVPFMVKQKDVGKVGQEPWRESWKETKKAVEIEDEEAMKSIKKTEAENGSMILDAPFYLVALSVSGALAFWLYKVWG